MRRVAYFRVPNGRIILPKRQPFGALIANWTPEERIDRAKVIIERLTYKLDDALQRHENNEYVQFRDEFISQIPKSRGANAFVVLQQDLASYEVIRLLALWDREADNALSIPTAIALINDDAVIASLEASVLEHHKNSRPHVVSPPDDPEDAAFLAQQIKRMQEEFGEERSKKNTEYCRRAIKAAADLINDEVKLKLQNLRDHRAHSLDFTYRERKGPIGKPLFKDVAFLLDRSTEIVELLYSSVNGVSYSLAEDTRDLCRERSKEFWEAIRFDTNKTERAENA